jgi:hypothetical protein
MHNKLDRMAPLITTEKKREREGIDIKRKTKLLH